MKTMAQKAIFTLMVMLLANGLIFADGNDPKKDNANIRKLSGQVVDQVTGETLTGVKVFIPGTDKAVYTDFDGFFQIEYDITKDTQVSISLISYEIKSLKVGDSEIDKIKLERQK